MNGLTSAATKPKKISKLQNRMERLLNFLLDNFLSSVLFNSSKGVNIMASLESILERTESVTVREIGEGKKRFELIIDNQVIGTIKGKEKMSSRYEFTLTLEDGTYAGKICERFSPTRHFSEVYDADDNKVMEFKRAIIGKGWAVVKDAEGTLLARMDKEKEGEMLSFELFDIYDADKKRYVGSIEQCDKGGKHAYNIRVPILDNKAIALFTALADQIVYHTKGGKL